MKLVLGPGLNFRPVEDSYYKVLLASTVIWGLIFLLPMIILAIFLASFEFPGVLLWVLAAVILVILLISFVFVKRRARAIGYVELENELVVRRGIFFQRLAVVPYGRMQQVNVSAGPLLNRFGLSEIELVTAAVTTNVKIPGIARTEAERLREKLTALGASQMEGL
ncbi:MAG: PH domain-containing protein [Arcanobacterium sp.]|nr:PH domain-containing protein [Arcanobacterium sp.]